MAEAQSSRNTDHHPEKALTDLDLAAAQQLMQLSDEDNNNNSSSNSKNMMINQDGDEVDQSPLITVNTWAKIQEIFGKEEDIDRPKKRRYRSLANIYLTTKTVNARSSSSYGKKVRTF